VPVVLGVISGVLAGAMAVAVAMPLTWTLRGIEERATEAQMASIEAQIASRADDGAPDLPALLAGGGVEGVALYGTDGKRQTELGLEIPMRDLPKCESDGYLGTHWRVRCVPVDGGTVVVGKRVGTWFQVALLWQAIGGSVVAMVTAIGVGGALRPITDVVRALARVERGERGVVLPRNRLSELDELIQHVNSTARAMDEREDSIAARLRTVQELARMVAHEIRNPLQTLELLTSLIASEEDTVERHTIAQSIHTEIKALDQVVQRVLRGGLAGTTLTIHRVRRNVVALVDQVISLRRTQAASQGINLVRGDVTYRPVFLDPALIGRSIENLVVNALQAVPKGQGLIVVSAFEDGEALAIAVDDNGPGVEANLGGAIFEANVSTKADGSGLGLALVKGVVEAHGGRVEYVRSELGGARFVIRLPTGREREVSGESGEFR
jgi:signal transduction histidine kinase